MTEEALDQEIEGLTQIYGEVARAMASSGPQLVRILEARLPRGCSPGATPVLLVLVPGRPQVYVKPGILLPNGRAPRSTSAVAIEGEEWLQFSFAFPWDENAHTLVQFVETSLQRFGKIE